MARKRASMREGPLADLFRSTEEASERAEIVVSDNGVESGAGGIAVADPDAEVTEKPTPKRKAAPKRQAKQAAKRGKGSPKRKTARRKAKPVKPEVVAPEAEVVEEEEVEVEVHTEGQPIEIPALDELEAELEEMRSLRITQEPEVEVPEPRERLRHLISEPRQEPAYGREGPDPDRASVMPRSHQAVLRVVGVGGAGVNAVNRMVEAQIPGVEFVAVNTDLQSLQISNADTTLHIGAELTRGLGSGSDPRVGYRAAFEEQEKVRELLRGSDMVFVTAGAGGGTGTGAAPVVARLAREVGALTVAIVSKPFAFEGAKRMAQAEEGIAALGAEVDTLIVVPNERLLQILERRTSMVDAFRVADDVLRQAVQGISDLVMLPGLINLDFADVRTTMLEAGDAILGIGMGSGEHRSIHAAEKAVRSPLLDTSVDGARSLLLSITGGPDLSLIEASEAAKIVQEAAHPEANIIFGANIDEDLEEQVWVTVIATRFDSAFARRYQRRARADDRDRGRTPRRPRDPVPPPGFGPGSDRRTVDIPEFVPGH